MIRDHKCRDGVSHNGEEMQALPLYRRQKGRRNLKSCCSSRAEVHLHFHVIANGP